MRHGEDNMQQETPEQGLIQWAHLIQNHSLVFITSDNSTIDRGATPNLHEDNDMQQTMCKQVKGLIDFINVFNSNPFE